jgi:hypothetical protein
MISKQTTIDKFFKHFNESRVHPNPSHDLFVLKTNITFDERYNMIVVDMLGKVIESWESISENGRLVFGPDYKPGMYIVRVTRGE